MRADHQMALQTFISTALSQMYPFTSHTVSVLATALVVGVEHTVNVAGHTIRYTVLTGDTEADIAAGLVADAADLSAAVGIVATDIGGGLFTLTRTEPFPVVAEPPLSRFALAPRAKVIWARESAPQANTDYAVLDPGQDAGEGREEVEQAVDPVMGTTTIRSLRIQEFTLTLLGSWTGVDARRVRRALESPQWGTQFVSLEPYVIRNIAVLLDAAAQNDTMYAPRIALGITLAYADSRRIDADVIENIEATGTVGSQALVVTVP